MKCLRCGHCCINYDVIIVKDPSLGPIMGNLEHKPSGKRCPHLRGDIPGEFSCKIHDEPWYQETPCAQFSQIESSIDDPCRMGEYLLQRKEDT